MALSDRKKQILKSVIDAYIDSGEPVGSKYLTAYGNISLSPATIRNEMSELEEMGYLDKPHTSAGRIPSSSAYRLYVDELMENYRLTMEELSVINELAHFKASELDRIITQAGKVMSDLTHCVTLSFTKEHGGDVISRFDTVYVDESSFLLVMISGEKSVRSEHIRTDCFITEQAVVLLKDILNENLAGVTIEQVTMPLIMKMEAAAGHLAPIINPIIRVAFSCSDPSVGGDGTIKINGLSNLLEYPEFSDLGKLRSIIDVFDKRKEYIKDLLTAPAQREPEGGASSENGAGNGELVPMQTDSGMKIYIGDDAGGSALSDTSLVFCTVPTGSTESVIGILGPKRMDYRKVVSTLRQFTESIGKALEQNDPKSGAENDDKTNGE